MVVNEQQTILAPPGKVEKLLQEEYLRPHQPEAKVLAPGEMIPFSAYSFPVQSYEVPAGVWAELISRRDEFITRHERSLAELDPIRRAQAKDNLDHVDKFLLSE